MDISLDSIEALAPDQSSLTAAKKLLKKQSWPSTGKSESHNSIWGVCQGSGANPYYTMVDLSNLGYKCTCPSRKFPCKHVLALMWQFSEQLHDFNEEELPTWVQEWHGRRRKSTSSEPAPSGSPTENKNIKEAATEDTTKPDKQKLKNAKRSKSLKATTDQQISAGLEELEQWIEDQLRSGINQFLKEIHERCRNISARLVDAKASNLAVKLDELPSLVLDYPTETQPSIVIREFGRYAILCNAWFADLDNPEARRDIAQAEKKEDLFKASNRVISGIWQTIGEQSYTRKDGLVTKTAWLIHHDSQNSHHEPVFAKLIDHIPAAMARNQIGFSFQTCVYGDLVYYPAQVELRGVLQNYEILPKPYDQLWSANNKAFLEHVITLQSRCPWIDQIPYMLSQGRVVTTITQQYWWLGQGDSERILLSNDDISTLVLGSEIERAFIIWDGHRGQLLSVFTKQWGAISC